MSLNSCPQKLVVVRKLSKGANGCYLYNNGQYVVVSLADISAKLGVIPLSPTAVKVFEVRSLCSPAPAPQYAFEKVIRYLRIFTMQRYGI